MAATVAARPSMTLQRELNRQITSTGSIHETNYTLIVSSVLIALSLTALLWLVVNVTTASRATPAVRHSLPRDVINPTADVAENSAIPRFPALSMLK